MDGGKVLCVTSNFPRWSGDSTTPFVFDLARDVREFGWKVDVLAPHAPGAADFELLDGIEVNRFRYAWPDSQQTVCCQGGALVNLRKHPLNYLKLPSLVVAQFLAMNRLLAGGDYDLIHAHWILPQGFNGALMGKFRSIPHILTVHGGDVFGLQGRALSMFKKFALNGANKVTVNSSYTQRAVGRMLKRGSSLVRIPMGVKTDPLSGREKELANSIRKKFRSADGPLIVFVGRLVEEKGLGDLLQAVQLLKDGLNGINLLVIGDGQDRDRFEQMASSLGIAKRVYFLGWIGQADIRAHFKAGDIFIGPSKKAADGWVEAQGLTFCEAMAVGVPVIATRSGGIPDAVVDGESGLLVPESDPKSIADAVLALMKSSDLRLELIENGIGLANSLFSKMKCAKRFARLFDESRRQYGEL